MRNSVVKDIGKLILEDLNEIIKLLNAIIKTTKRNSSLSENL